MIFKKNKISLAIAISMIALVSNSALAQDSEESLSSDKQDSENQKDKSSSQESNESPNLLSRKDPRDKYEDYKQKMDEAKEKSSYELSPDSDAYIDLMNREQLKRELNNLYNQMDNEYSLENQMNNELPLPPEDIIKYRKRKMEVEKAQNIPITSVNEEYRTENLDMQQNKPIRINIVPGYLATLTFFDSTGQPWPVEYAQPGNDSFQMSVAGKEGNVININTNSGYTSANASIGLADMSTNLTVTLNANQNSNTSKLEFRIPEQGPNADTGPIQTSSMVENAPSEMFDFINGRIYNLPGAKSMKVNGVDAEAYVYNDFMYVISKHNLRSPARENSVSLPSGKHAYKIYPTSTLQFAVNGKSVFATVEEEIQR